MFPEDTESDLREREMRSRRFHQVEVPALRLLGFVGLGLLLELNRRFVGGPARPHAALLLAVLAYNLGTWLALRVSRRHGERLGLLFLSTDLALFATAVYYSGAERSWLFFLPLVRVADQTATRFRRVLVFVHLAVLAYLGVVLVAQHQGHAINWSVEGFKLALLYAIGVYISLTARTAERLRRQLARAVHVARESLAHARGQTTQLEQARRAAEAANVAKSEFLANMSHEIRTPMTAIQGYCDLLFDAELTEVERVSHVQTIRRNSDHLLSILNDILDLSKIEAGKMVIETIPCSPCQVLSDVASLMRVRAIEKGVGFDVRFHSPVPKIIQSDPTRLRQILMNLVSNAIKFTESGGVAIGVRCENPKSARPRLSFDVVDSGVGMSEEQLAGLFRPFTQADASTTRKFGGTGLGLFISQRMVTMLGGELKVDSTVGRGSAFTVSIDPGPLSDVELVRDPSESVSREGTSPGHGPLELDGRILLAEDGVDNRLLITTHLARAGAQVTAVENGLLAVERALAAEAAGEPFDVVLMDMQMPELDGYGATARLRSLGYRRPIVALTAHAMAGDRQRCIGAGCNDYLSKPIARHKLLGLVARWMQAEQDEEVAMEPLRSTYAEDPEMASLIASYISTLAERIAAIRVASTKNDLPKLRTLAHQLSGSAGGYGYPTISAAAAKLEHATAAQAPTAQHVSLVLGLCERAVGSSPP